MRYAMRSREPTVTAVAVNRPPGEYSENERESTALLGFTEATYEIGCGGADGDCAWLTSAFRKPIAIGKVTVATPAASSKNFLRQSGFCAMRRAMKVTGGIPLFLFRICCKSSYMLQM